MPELSLPGKEKKLIIFRNYLFFLFACTLVLRIILVPWHIADFIGGDMNVVYGVQRILSGSRLYLDPAKAPYAVIQYTPLYYYVTAAIARILRLGMYDVQDIYEITRVLNIVFNLLTVLFAAMAIRLWRFSWKNAIAFALPVFMIPTVHYYGRCDSLHLFFFIAALYTLLHFLDKRAVWKILPAALFSACCVMSKQSGMLVMLIIGSYLLFAERKLWLAFLYGTASLICSWLIVVCSSGSDWQPFYQNAYLGLKNGVDLSYVYTIFISQFYYDFIPFYFLGGLMVYHAARHVTDKLYKFVVYSAVFSFFFAVITGLKIGSSNNYFTEFLVVVVIGIPYLLRDGFAQKELCHIRKYRITARHFAFFALFILTTSKTLGLFTSIYIEKRLKDNIAEYGTEQELLQYFKNELSLGKGEHIFFTEKRFFDNIFFDNGIFPSKDVISQVYLSNPGTYNYSSFLAGINSGQVTYIVTSKEQDDINRYTKDLLPFIRFDTSKFEKITDRGAYMIYRFHQ